MIQKGQDDEEQQQWLPFVWARNKCQRQSDRQENQAHQCCQAPLHQMETPENHDDNQSRRIGCSMVYGPLKSRILIDRYLPVNDGFIREGENEQKAKRGRYKNTKETDGCRALPVSRTHCGCFSSRPLSAFPTCNTGKLAIFLQKGQQQHSVIPADQGMTECKENASVTLCRLNRCPDIVANLDSLFAKICCIFALGQDFRRRENSADSSYIFRPSVLWKLHSALHTEWFPQCAFQPLLQAQS